MKKNNDNINIEIDHAVIERIQQLPIGSIITIDNTLYQIFMPGKFQESPCNLCAFDAITHVRYDKNVQCPILKACMAFHRKDNKCVIFKQITGK